MLKRLPFLLFISCLLLFIGSCGSSQNLGGVNDTYQHPGYQSVGDNLVAVRMNPAPVQDPPFADSGLGKAASSPRTLIETLQPLKRASFIEEDLLREGGSFDATLPLNHVEASGVGDTMATFSPMWDGVDDTLADAAYSLYRFPLDGYGDTTREQTLGFEWADAEPAAGDLWVGFGNLGKDQWDWYEGEDDGVLSLGDYTPYEAEDGSVLCAIVLLGELECVLNQMQIGEFEIRGTGDDDEVEFTPVPEFPPFNFQAVLTVDLTPGCAPIGDQGGTSSCTGFAVANGALNYEMNAVYGDCGWDFNKPFNRASPRFVYNQTRIDLGGTCPSGGRNTNDVGTWVLVNGSASEFNAPIGSVSPSSNYNCNTNWTQPALDDAGLMKPKVKAFWGIKHPTTDEWYLDDDRIDSIRYVLRVARKPVVFRTDLDSNFSNVDYENGGSWTYAGPRTGGHAMMVVGYDDDRNGGSFKVRNSWGTNWGDDGYCWITYNSFKSSTAGVYAFYFIGQYDQDVADRFCPSPPPFLPPLDIQFEPITTHVEFSWPAVPGATRYQIYRDDQKTPIGFSTEPFYEDLTVDDFATHVYWFKAVGNDGESPFSSPVMAWKKPSLPPL